MLQCNLLLCASITLWIGVTGIQQHVTYKAAVGLLFTHEEQLTLRASGQFQLNFLLSLPPFQEMAQEVYQEEMVNIECQLKGEGQALCLYLKNITKLELKQLKHLKLHTEKLMKIFDDLHDQIRITDQQQKRAWLPLSGVFQTIFGTAKSQDVKKLKGQLKQLSQNAQILDSNYDSLYSAFQDLYNSTSEGVNGLIALVRHQDEVLLSTLHHLDKIDDKINDFLSFASPAELNYLLEIMSVLHRLQQRARYIMAFHNTLTSFNDGLRQLARNHLPPSLISPRSLHKGLARFNNKLRQFNLQPLPYNHLKQYYYRTSTVLGHILDNTLVVTLHVPIITTPAHFFDAYYMESLPIPIHNNEGTNQQPFMRLQLQNDYLLISTNKQYYGFATTKQMDECKSHELICNLPLALYQPGQDSCEYNIFNNMDNTDNCDFRIYNAPETKAAYTVGTDQILLHNFQSPIQVNCLNQEPTQLDITSHTIVTMGCYCYIIADDVVFGPRVQGCEDGHNSQVLTEFPVNLALAKEMSALNKFQFPLVNFKSKTKPKADFTDISKYIDQLQNDLHTSFEIGVKANTVFTKLKEYEKQKLDNTVYVTDEDSMSWLEILLFSTLTVWNILLTIAFIAYVMFARHGQQPDLPNIATLASALPMALAIDIRPPTTQITSPCDAAILEDELNLIGYTLLIASAAFSLYIIYKLIAKLTAYRQLQNYAPLNQSAALYYKIFTTHHICILFLRDIPVDSRIKVQALPRFAGFALERNACWPKMRMDWETDLTLSLGPDQLRIPMPTTFFISLSNFKKLTHIIQDVNYYGCLLIKRHDQDCYNNIRNEDSTAPDI